ncbi:unnamed protein product, partial [Prorocentrum cordatum]
MDTFLIRDPTPRILSQAEGFDALFSRHADGDCVNIGVFYLRSTPETAVWLSQFLAWYHDHPFEIDQRGLQVFLRLPSERVQIAYPPADLVGIRAGVLDDVNEFVIGVSGWHGAHERLLILHWCEKPIWSRRRRRSGPRTTPPTPQRRTAWRWRRRCSRPRRLGGGAGAPAVAKRSGSPVGPPRNALSTACGLHEMPSEHFWLRRSCFDTSASCSKKMV